MMTTKPDVLAVAKLHPFYLQALQTIYTVHDRTHTEDPNAFATLAPRIVGVAGTGEASVPRSLLSQLPNAKVVSVFGVGYDGVDVAAAIEHGIPVTHTPDVLTDDVADRSPNLGAGPTHHRLTNRADPQRAVGAGPQRRFALPHRPSAVSPLRVIVGFSASTIVVFHPASPLLAL